MAQWIDHSSDEDALKCLSIIRASAGLDAVLDMANVACCKYLMGQPWQRNASSSIMPQSVTKDFTAIGVNQIRPLVWQWRTRLRVRDWANRFRTTDDDPEVRVCGHLLQAWYDRWIATSNQEEVFDLASFLRLITQGSVVAWDFDPDAPGGIRQRQCYPQRWSTDPGNTSPNWDDHETLVESFVITVDAAKRRFGPELERLGVDLESQARLVDLVAAESCVGSALFGQNIGAALSESPGVVVRVMFDKKHTRRTVFLQNVRPKGWTRENSQHQWLKLKQEEWPYGRTALKLGTFDVPVTSWARSLVAELIPFEDVMNLANRIDLRAGFNSAKARLAAVWESIINKDEATSDKDKAVLWLRSSSTPTPQWIAPPRVDLGTQNIIGRTMLFLREAGHITEGMAGKIQPRVPLGAYAMGIQQGSSVIQAVADADFLECNRYLNRMARAAVMYYAAKDNKRAWVQFVGKTRANLRGLAASRRLLATTETACVLKKQAFVAETPQETLQRLESEFQAGRYPTVEHYHLQILLQTGISPTYGLDDALHNADELVRRILDGDPPARVVRQGDKHWIVVAVIDRLLEQRATAEYDEKQIAALETAKLLCEYHMGEQAYRKGLVAEMGGGASGSANGPGPGQGVSSAALPQGQAAVASSAVGESVAATV